MQYIVPSCALGKELCTILIIQVFVFRVVLDFASKRELIACPAPFALLDDERFAFESIFTNIKDRPKVSV